MGPNRGRELLRAGLPASSVVISIDRILLFLLQVVTPGIAVLALAADPASEAGTDMTSHEMLSALVATLAVSAAAFRLIWPLTVAIVKEPPPPSA